MCKGLIGKKVGMVSVFTPEGKQIPATVIQAGPCVVTQIKQAATDGYNALQLGLQEKKAKRTTQPLIGHFVKSGGACYAHLREVDVDNPADYKLGQTVGPEVFKVGERVDVAGTIKGRGFAGVMKRHGFSGGRMTHGCQSKRIPGSIGSSAWPSRVRKGQRLPGHYGNVRQTVRNLEIVDIRAEGNLILLKGAVPGANTGLVAISKQKGAE
jgi:large subunit ribosomal protein L3